VAAVHHEIDSTTAADSRTKSNGQVPRHIHNLPYRRNDDLDDPISGAGKLDLNAEEFGIGVVRPTGIEPVLKASEAFVISFSLRARGEVFYHRVADQSTCDRVTAVATRTISWWS
jgi:hypothetical protein